MQFGWQSLRCIGLGWVGLDVVGLGSWFRSSTPNTDFPGWSMGNNGGLGLVFYWCWLRFWSGVVGFGLVWYNGSLDLVFFWCWLRFWSSVVGFGLVWFGLARLGLVLALVWFLVWCRLVWFGLVWFGLVWFGLVWFGLVWFGFVGFG